MSQSPDYISENIIQGNFQDAGAQLNKLTRIQLVNWILYNTSSNKEYKDSVVRFLRREFPGDMF